MSRFRASGRGRLAGLFPLMAIGLLMPTRSAEGQEVGEVFRDCEVCPEMVVVPAGSFVMGSPETEEERDFREDPQHRVTIGYAFAVGVYEVTFDEWDACVEGGGCGGYDPDDEGWGRGSRPVINVHWGDAWLYADWLTEQTGQEYRLPSEAEWEYAARAGTQSARYWGEADREQCRYVNGYDAFAHIEIESHIEPVGCRDRQVRTAPVGSYRPNGFGLYDVLGNVWEWVDDCRNHDYEGAPSDGSSWLSGDCTWRMFRGGSWGRGPEYLRSATRGTWFLATTRTTTTGFRVVRTIP